MVEKIDTAIIKLWNVEVGAVSWLDDQGYAVFEFSPDFFQHSWDISPLHMGIEKAMQGERLFSFPSLPKTTFLGLPGLLADALPDKFGNNIISAWLARHGRVTENFSPIERLCYTGKRGMGALEFEPVIIKKYDRPVPVEVSELVKLVQTVMEQRTQLSVNFSDSENENCDAITDILRVGTSAGGARAKAVIALNKKGDVISGQADVPSDYDYWLLKFDGVTDLELGEPRGYGRIEYAYYLMALAAGISMTECRLLEENGRAHFMTKRFDRINKEKIHMQSLCGLAHYDFNQAGAYSYEQVFAIMRQLRMPKSEWIKQYRRMLFNVIARNQDDHTKNIGFIMNKKGKWSLSPAYDVNYSHNPHGRWTNQHQMSINGKRDHFTKEDLIRVGESINIPKPKAIIAEVAHAIENWSTFAKEAGINKTIIEEIGSSHRIKDII